MLTLTSQIFAQSSVVLPSQCRHGGEFWIYIYIWCTNSWLQHDRTDESWDTKDNIYYHNVDAPCLALADVEVIGWCRTQCKQFVICLRLARCCLSCSKFDDIAIQVDEMWLASAFSLLGIRRNAEDHALLSILKSSNSFGQIEMQDLINLIDRHVSFISFGWSCK